LNERPTLRHLEQNPSWKLIFPLNQESLHILWNSKFRYCLYNSVPLTYPKSDESCLLPLILFLYDTFEYCTTNSMSRLESIPFHSRSSTKTIYAFYGFPQ